MKGTSKIKLLAWLVGASALIPASTLLAQNPPPPDHPAVTVKGQTYTPRSILARNMGTPEDQTSQFPPHKVIGNIYYVGTKTLSSYLITSPQGHILINSTYERNVPVIQKSVADLGFRFSDIKILLGTHAHGDHQEGDAAVKQATGAQVMVMEQDVPALRNIKPGGKEHPIDWTFGDGEKVQLGPIDPHRASHGRSHARLHHLDHAGARGRPDVQCRLRMQPARARNDLRRKSSPSSRARSRNSARSPATCLLAIIPRSTI